MGLFSAVGDFLNDLTGVSSSASQAQRYAIQNAELNHKYQKEFMQNAHQWEMEDLKKAGLNPALTATGGSGASASGGGSFGGATGTSSGNPIDMIMGTVSSLVGMKNQTSATRSQNNLNEAQSILAIAQAKNIPQELKLKAQNALAAMITANANAANAETNKYNSDYGKQLLRKIATDAKKPYRKPTLKEQSRGILF